MPSKITRRILTEAGAPDLDSALSEGIGPSELQSLLLEVYARRVSKLRESDVVSRTVRTPLLTPSNVDARIMHRFDQIAFAAAKEFEAIDLSPVCALGASSVLGHIHQNNVLTTIRNAEVLGDSTPVLALEAAGRRRANRGSQGKVAHNRAGSELGLTPGSAPRAGRSQPVRLCSSHRVVRLQPFDFPGFTPHFRLFALVSAGRDTGAYRFELRELETHIRFYLRLFRGLNAAGFRAGDPLVEISDLTATEALLNRAGCSREDVRKSVRAHLPGGSQRFLEEHGLDLPSNLTEPPGQWPHLGPFKERVFALLAAEFPEAQFHFNFARLEGLGYYSGLCLRISPRASDGVRHPVADGGFTDWTARLLQDRKERCLISGIGSEFVCRRYLGDQKFTD